MRKIKCNEGVFSVRQLIQVFFSCCINVCLYKIDVPILKGIITTIRFMNDGFDHAPEFI